MKNILHLFWAGIVVLILGGCSGDIDEYYAEECNVKLLYLNSTDGSGSASSIRLDNDSDYTIEEVYSGVNGSTEVTSVFIPTEPGEFFIADSANCGDDEILRIMDDEGCEQEIAFYRACDQTANFEVVNNF